MPALVRDRLTWLTFAQLGVYGYFLYGFGPSVPLLRDDLGVSSAVSGLHGTALAAGSLLAGAAFARLTARVGRAAALRLGLVGVAGGVLLYCLSPALPMTLAGALACGFFGSVVVTGTIVVLGTHHGPAGPAAISEANALAAGAGLLAPLLVGAGVSAGLGWRPGILVTTVVAAIVWVLSVRFDRRSTPASLAPNGAPPAGAGDEGFDVDAPGPLPGRYWLAWLVLVLCIGVEFCLTFWAADGLRERTGASPAAATAGVTAIVGGMFAGRVIGGRIALRVDAGRLLLGALALAAVGFAAFWVSTVTVAALAGLVLVGLGIALHFPLAAARAVAVSGGRPDLAGARVSWAAGLASGVAPFALGAVADRVGTHTAFLLVPVLLAAAAGCVLASLRERAPSTRRVVDVPPAACPQADPCR